MLKDHSFFLEARNKGTRSVVTCCNTRHFD